MGRPECKNTSAKGGKLMSQKSHGMLPMMALALGSAEVRELLHTKRKFEQEHEKGGCLFAIGGNHSWTGREVGLLD